MNPACELFIDNETGEYFLVMNKSRNGVVILCEDGSNYTTQGDLFYSKLDNGAISRCAEPGVEKSYRDWFKARNKMRELAVKRDQQKTLATEEVLCYKTAMEIAMGLSDVKNKGWQHE